MSSLNLLRAATSKSTSLPLCLSKYSSVSLVNNLHSGSVNCVGSKYRVEHMKPANINEYGPLTDQPDYSFKDGTPAPPGPGSIKKYKKHKAFAEKILKLTEEVDYAVARAERRKKEKAEREAGILERKLKPKSADISKKRTLL